MKNPGLAKSFILSATFLGGLDAYVVLCVMAAASLWLKWLFILPSAVYILIIARTFLFCDRSQRSLNQTIGGTLLIFFPILIFTLLSLLGLLVSLFYGPSRIIFNYLGVAAAVAWIAMSLYGICRGWKRIQTDRVTLSFPDLPEAFDGYKIVHLSDFHIGTYSRVPHIVERIVDQTNSLMADMIVFTGDLVNTSSAEIVPFESQLSRLSAPDGVLSVLGNHDYCLYRHYTAPDSPQKELARIIKLEREAGWTVLLNESVTVERRGDRIAVTGVENAGGKGFPDMCRLSDALQDTENVKFKILLSHDPSHWRREVVKDTDIQLTLSGHTHGMQFRLGPLTPSRLGYREWGGVYQLGRHRLVVNTGIGGNVAFRFGVYPQILLLTLKKS